MKCEFVFRPIGGQWHTEKTRYPRRSVFRSTYGATMRLLNRELNLLGVQRAVIGIDVTESMIRLDGLPRADARPRFQGVSLHFESKYGPLRYATDVFNDWHDNLRAIALGLEALRKVDRFGITKKGEQYTGWKQLPASIGEIKDRQMAAEYIARHSGYPVAHILEDPDVLKAAFAEAARKLHPDKNGNAGQMDLLLKARNLLNKMEGKL